MSRVTNVSHRPMARSISRNGAERKAMAASNSTSASNGRVSHAMKKGRRRRAAEISSRSSSVLETARDKSPAEYIDQLSKADELEESVSSGGSDYSTRSRTTGRRNNVASRGSRKSVARKRNATGRSMKRSAAARRSRKSVARKRDDRARFMKSNVAARGSRRSVARKRDSRGRFMKSNIAARKRASTSRKRAATSRKRVTTHRKDATTSHTMSSQPLKTVESASEASISDRSGQRTYPRNTELRRSVAAKRSHKTVARKRDARGRFIKSSARKPAATSRKRATTSRKSAAMSRRRGVSTKRLHNISVSDSGSPILSEHSELDPNDETASNTSQMSGNATAYKSRRRGRPLKHKGPAASNGRIRVH